MISTNNKKSIILLKLEDFKIDENYFTEKVKCFEIFKHENDDYERYLMRQVLDEIKQQTKCDITVSINFRVS